jgi:adenylate cyclase
VTAYAGPLLDGFHVSDAPDFERWVDGERDRLHRLFVGALESLARAAGSTGDGRAALDAWRRLAVLDPYNSRVARELMLVLEAAGDRAAAIRHARVHATLLREEFGAEPDPEVEALAERLRSAPAGEAGTEAPGAAAALSGAPKTGGAAAAGAPGEAAGAPADEDAAAGTAAGEAAAVGARVERPARAAPAPAAVRATNWRPRGRRPWRVSRRGRSQLSVRAATALLLLGASMMVAAVAWGRRGESHELGCSRGSASIAVLPFRSAGVTEELASFGDGLAEEILNALSRIDCLNVVPRTAAFELDEQLGADAVGRRLKVQYALSGSWRGGADWLRVDPRLIEVETGRVVWSDSYDLSGPWTVRDRLRVQENIAQATADALPIRIAGLLRREPLVRSSTSNHVAFQLLYTGRRHLAKRTIQDLITAARLFEQARDQDPLYAEAHAALAEATALLGAYDYGILRPAEAFPAALQSADRALALDSALAEAHATRGSVFFNYHYDWDRAEAAFQRAIALKPGYTQAYHWYSLMLAARGRMAEAQQQIEAALSLDRESVILLAARSRHDYFAGHFDRSVTGYEHALRLDPNYVTGHLGLGLAQLGAGRAADAIASFQRAQDLLAAPAPVIQALLGHAHGVAGDSGAARRQLAWLAGASREAYVPAEYFAIAHLGLREYDAAVDRLYEAFEHRSGGIAYLGLEPMLKPLHDHPRFIELRRRAGL